MRNKKTPRESEIKTSKLMMPNDANFAGHVHGGVILEFVDQVAYICAVRHSESYCVTAAVDRVDFKMPINVGELVHFDAKIIYVGKTSMDIKIEISAEDLKTRKIRHTNTCYATKVAVDEKMNPKEVPELMLETEEDKKLWKDAVRRREFHKV